MARDSMIQIPASFLLEISIATVMRAGAQTILRRVVQVGPVPATVQLFGERVCAH
jgi:hypothetical protein